MTRARHQSRSRSCRWTATLLVLTSLVLLGCEPDAPNGRVRLATTTSTHNSGLLDELIPPFEKATGLKVDVLAVGTGQALTLGERGDVDLVLVHARSREDEFVASGAGVDRRSIMWNDFVIVG
ncbi:MAG: substrate-binding domain-containing protein, partial [Planctomycetota bacterium]